MAGASYLESIRGKTSNSSPAVWWGSGRGCRYAQNGSAAIGSDLEPIWSDHWLLSSTSSATAFFSAALAGPVLFCASVPDIVAQARPSQPQSCLPRRRNSRKCPSGTFWLIQVGAAVTPPLTSSTATWEVLDTPRRHDDDESRNINMLTLGTGFGGGSWADEVEETYVSGTQPLPSRDSGRPSAMSSWQDRGYSVRESVPAKLPEKPPFTAHLGNLSYDATNESVTAFFEGCDVVSVRIIEDREMQRPKGFGYVEFGNLEGLKKALTLDGESFEGRMIKIKVADPPRGGDGRDGRGESTRDLSDWTRRGPLPDLPGARGPRTDFGERRPPRDPANEGRSTREMTWERRGPLSPLSPQEPGSRESSRVRGSQEGLGERGESYRGNRRDPATWGEGRQEGGRPPRQYNERPERPERPERTPTAAEKDFQWRDRMRPDSANAPAAETPASPGAPPPAQAQAPGGRPRLNLQKRTVSEVADSTSSGAGDSKASPFGAARPIDTAAREKEIEEKRLQAIQEKREADEKAKEDKRLAKEAAAAKAEAEAKEAAEAAEAKPEAKTEPETETKPAEEPKAEEETQNGATEQKVPIRTRDQPKDFNQGQKSRATESGNWRSASNEQRAPRGSTGRGRGGPLRGARNDTRAPRSNGQQAAAPAAEGDAPAPAADEDGWTTVSVGKKGRTGRV
ncbi:rna recognition motif containing [Trichoderma arundinaceum]|uniref:Rna recognition motif containing n=1 Tax=Trichoderma arundinaceum TaxID=490622 RepID=A0A395NIE0_TRIAR|nr:rna recognition motif containing [Trichoderma arundinaceum]